MTRRLLIFISVWLVSVFPPTSAQVLWIATDLQPCHDPSGAGYGYCDKVESLVFKQLPRFAFQRKIANLARMSSMMKEHKTFCTTDLLKNAERQQYMVFSKPVFYLMPPILVMRKNHSLAAQLSRNEIALSTLSDLDMRIGVREQRFYTQGINNFIDTHGDNKEVYWSATDNVLAEMVTGERIDATFMHAAELSFYDSSESLTGLAISGEQYTPVYFSCTKTGVGPDVIEALNTAISSLPAEQLSAPYMSYLPARLQPYYAENVKVLLDRRRR